MQEPDDGEVRGELRDKLAELESMNDEQFEQSLPDWLKDQGITRQQEIESLDELTKP